MPDIALFNLGAVSTIVDKLVFWFGLFLVCAIIGGAIFFFIHVLSFKYKTQGAYELLFDEAGRTYKGKKLSNRFKWNKHKTAWKSLWPLFNKNEFPAFPSEAIERKNKVNAARLPNGKWVPAITRLNAVKEVVEIEENGQKVQKEVPWVVEDFMPFPHYIIEHHILELEKNEQEFVAKTKWEENKPFIMFIGACLFCLVLCGATIYFTYNYAQSSFANIEQSGSVIAKAIENAAYIPGRGA